VAPRAHPSRERATPGGSEAIPSRARSSRPWACRPPCSAAVPLRAHEGSAAALVEVLEEVVGGELDLLVAPFGGPVLAGDQAHAVEAGGGAGHAGVPSLGRGRGSARG